MALCLAALARWVIRRSTVGALFAPGSGAPGTSITVRGNLAFQSGAIYLVQVNSTAASSANVTGTASLGGAVQAVFAPGIGNPAKSYDILRANGLGGTFCKTRDH